MCNLDEAIDKIKILEKQKTEQDDEVRASVLPANSDSDIMFSGTYDR